MKTKSDVYTLITGASSGLGKEIAIECARMEMNLILVALPGRSLKTVAEHIADLYKVKVQIFELDLTKDEDLTFLVERTNEGFPVNFLVNNAGAGGSSDFTTTPIKVIDNIIQLNIRATSLLTRMMVPMLLKQEKSYILNISSMAAFSPIAFKTVYPASKAFVYSFSLGLKEEFKNTSLSVSVVFRGHYLLIQTLQEELLGRALKGNLVCCRLRMLLR